MSAADAAAALLQTLSAKVERVITSCNEQQNNIDQQQDELRRLRNALRDAETTEARIKEYSDTQFSPSWESLCSSSFPPSTVTLRILEDVQGVVTGEVKTATTEFPQLVIGLPTTTTATSSSPSSSSQQQQHRLHGKTFEVSTLAGARCIAGYLRGSGFIAPNEAGALADVLHTANDMRLDELAMLVRDHILAAATSGEEV